jgi:hypothetical protein
MKTNLLFLSQSSVVNYYSVTIIWFQIPEGGARKGGGFFLLLPLNKEHFSRQVRITLEWSALRLISSMQVLGK